jgi:hypothetical protein
MNRILIFCMCVNFLFIFLLLVPFNIYNTEEFSNKIVLALNLRNYNLIRSIMSILHLNIFLFGINAIISKKYFLLINYTLSTFVLIILNSIINPYNLIATVLFFSYLVIYSMNAY